MTRTLLLSLPVLLGLVGPAPAQYYYPAAAPGDPRALVASWYERYLRREPDPGALGWIHSLQTGHSPENVLATILSSQEYFLRAGGTPAGYVGQLYLDFVGRPATEAELGFWLRRLRFESRKDVAYTILARHPQNWSGVAPAAGPGYYDPGYYPDPGRTYYQAPYPPRYEYRRPVRVSPLVPGR